MDLSCSYWDTLGPVFQCHRKFVVGINQALESDTCLYRTWVVILRATVSALTVPNKIMSTRILEGAMVLRYRHKASDSIASAELSNLSLERSFIQLVNEIRFYLLVGDVIHPTCQRDPFIFSFGYFPSCQRDFCRTQAMFQVKVVTYLSFGLRFKTGTVAQVFE